MPENDNWPSGPAPLFALEKNPRSVCLLREDLCSRLIPHLQSRSAVHRIRVSISPRQLYAPLPAGVTAHARYGDMLQVQRRCVFHL
jgi:hypothetical protein